MIKEIFFKTSIYYSVLISNFINEEIKCISNYKNISKYELINDTK